MAASPASPASGFLLSAYEFPPHASRSLAQPEQAAHPPLVAVTTDLHPLPRLIIPLSSQVKNGAPQPKAGWPPPGGCVALRHAVARILPQKFQIKLLDERKKSFSFFTANDKPLCFGMEVHLDLSLLFRRRASSCRLICPQRPLPREVGAKRREGKENVVRGGCGCALALPEQAGPPGPEADQTA